MIVRNEEIVRVTVETPAGHRHLRTAVLLSDGTELVFQEAAIANIVRAYIGVKTHPAVTKVILKGQRVAARKEGYAEWQLLEEEEDDG